MPSRFIFPLSGLGGRRGLWSAECGKYGVWNMRSVENADLYDHINVNSVTVNGDMLSPNCKNYNVRSMIT